MRVMSYERAFPSSPCSAGQYATPERTVDPRSWLLCAFVALCIASGCQSPVLGPLPCESVRQEICHDYLLAIRDGVYERWRPPMDAPRGEVQLYFRVQGDGTVGDTEVEATSEELAESCEAAFAQIQPLPVPPPDLENKRLLLTFGYE